jgi:hypothetical protein
MISVKKSIGIALFTLGAVGILPLLALVTWAHLGGPLPLWISVQGYAVALFAGNIMIMAAGFCLFRASDPIDEGKH